MACKAGLVLTMAKKLTLSFVEVVGVFCDGRTAHVSAYAHAYTHFPKINPVCKSGFLCEGEKSRW